MNILVVGARGTLGRAVVSELVARGHVVFGLTRHADHANDLEERGAKACIGDALSATSMCSAFGQAEPDSVIALLSDRPPRSPTRLREFRSTVRLWREAMPNIITAASAVGAHRIVASSVIFAYGYGDQGLTPIDESAPAIGGAALRGQSEVLDALRSMERQVLGAERSGVEGLVARLGLLYGPDVPSTSYVIDALRRRRLMLPGGAHGLLSWVEISDAARGIADVLERGTSSTVYNVVDDTPQPFATYAAALSTLLDTRPPRKLPLVLSRVVAPHAASYLADTRLAVSNERIKSELGWRPRYASLSTGLQQLRDCPLSDRRSPRGEETGMRVGTLSWAETTGGKLRPRDRIRLLGQGTVFQARELPRQAFGLFGARFGRLAEVDVDQIRLPDSTACRDAEEICGSIRPALFISHSYRTFMWATILAKHLGFEYDEEVLFVSSLLHDLGLSENGQGPGAPTCFTLVGARATREVCADAGWERRRADLAAEAITLHMNLRQRRSDPEAYLMAAGTQLDVIGAQYWKVAPETVRAVVARYPRHEVKAGMVRAFDQQAAQRKGSRAQFYHRYLSLGFRLRHAPFDE
ncbi:MAG: hypothetical protein QOI95_2093 [Acidimicrobiaceae bacterium]|jgi:nucleoside-diphosphate-sugar epimerase